MSSFRRPVALADTNEREAGDPTLGLAASIAGETSSAASDAAIYTFGVYAAQVLIFVAGLVQKGILGPTSTGYWTLVSLLLPFAAIGSLGAFHGAMRQVPTYRGRYDYRSAASAADTAASFSIPATGAVGLVIAAVALVFGADWAPQLRWGLVGVGLLMPLQTYADFHESLFQATRRFPVLSATVILKGLLIVTVQTLFVWLFGFYGMLLGVAALIFGRLLFWRSIGVIGRLKPAFHWRFHRRRLSELISAGIPILVYVQIWVLFVTVDSLLVAHFVSVTSLGYYALAVSVTNYVLLLPSSVAIALFARMQERYAQSEEAHSIWRYTSDVQKVLAYVLVPLFVASAFFLLPVVITHALPAFEPAIPVVHIMVAASLCISLVPMVIEFLITTGHRWRATRLMIACLVVNAAANYVAVAVLDRGVKGAAVATAISYLVTCVVLTGYGASRAIGMAPVVRHLATLLLAIGYAVALLWAIELSIPAESTSVAIDALTALGKTVLFVVFFSPWLLIAQRRFRILTLIWQLLTAVARTGRSSALVSS
jgi:O-antigen/teichoic acid export membrane protein